MKKDCNIGNVRLANPFLLAPLAGVTDAPFRRICGEMGAGLVYSEMVSAKGLWYKDKNTDRLLEILDGEAPVAYQIFGHEPEIMAEAVHMLNERKHVLLDINMGCPVPKIVRNGEGSALMRNPDLAQRVVEAAVSAGGSGEGKLYTVSADGGGGRRVSGPIPRLQAEAKAYMHHPVEWYRFNTTLLQYDLSTKAWSDLGEYEQLARAGAGAVIQDGRLTIINGELKPGIRTPQVNQAKL